MGIKILIVDDHKLMRDGLRSLLNEQTGLEVIATAENGRVAIKMTKQLKPDVVVMDISMPDMNGIEATRQILSDVPGTKVLALSMHSDRRFIDGMLSAGVSGYLSKDCAIEEVSHAVRTVIDNRTYLCQGAISTVVKGYIAKLSKKETYSFYALSSREREVLQLIAEGKKTKEMAAQLNVSIKTIETHRRQIMEKLNINNIAELTKFAVREGLTSLE